MLRIDARRTAPSTGVVVEEAVDRLRARHAARGRRYPRPHLRPVEHRAEPRPGRTMWGGVQVVDGTTLRLRSGVVVREVRRHLEDRHSGGR